jgi:hypothetical protein
MGERLCAWMEAVRNEEKMLGILIKRIIGRF